MDEAPESTGRPGDAGGLRERAERVRRGFRARLRVKRLHLKRRLSPFLLLDERGGALVRALMISTRRRRWMGSAVCALMPAAGFLLLVLLANAGGGRRAVPLRRLEDAAGVFVCAWPLVMFTGAAIASAATTIAERESGSVVQLVLSPISKRDIAASKVLPYVVPFLVGTVAALPIYLWIGTSPDLLIDDRYPGPQAAWPTRAFILLNSGGDWRLATEARGFAAGLLMTLGDLAAVWAAAHWGAALAVRLGKLTLVAAYLVGRALGLIAFTSVAWVAAWVVGAFVGSVIYGLCGSQPTGLMVGVLLGTGVYLAGWWAFLYFWPVSGALERFESFDRLADEDYRPRLWERFNPRKFREHIRTRRH
jgi:hypothetical protein